MPMLSSRNCGVLFRSLDSDQQDRPEVYLKPVNQRLQLLDGR